MHSACRFQCPPSAYGRFYHPKEGKWPKVGPFPGILSVDDRVPMQVMVHARQVLQYAIRDFLSQICFKQILNPSHLQWVFSQKKTQK